ncbi:hypothetical protein JNJ66_00590 [Candidatus Saccharibacteria bacterium]|nr:hypothetical protein [Candidatus Saccharibacteria bacterium]
MKTSEPADTSTDYSGLPAGLDVLALKFAAHPLANLETYKYFNQHGPMADTVKAHYVTAALNGNTPEAPQFFYPEIDVEALIAYRDELSLMLEEVVELGMTEEPVRILRESIANRVHEIGIMILSKLQSQQVSDGEMYLAVSRQLGRMMREIYGAPSAKHWRRVLGARLQQLSAVAHVPDVPREVQNAWRHLSQSLPDNLPIERSYMPDGATVEYYTRQLFQRMRPSLDAVEAGIESGEVPVHDGSMDAGAIVAATRLALKARDFTRWRVRLTDEANIDTCQADRTIYIPRTRRLTLKEFDAVVQSHEIDQHVARRENGDACGHPLIGGFGCTGYLSWEEGNGKVNEALVYGDVNSEAVANGYYFSVGLALGLDGRALSGRNFTQTFELIWRARLIEAYLDGRVEDAAEATRTIMFETFEHLRRIFRGTDGRVPGVVFTKDALTYYIGQTEVWRKWDRDMQLSEPQRQAEHRLERFAKIHPLRADHRRLTLAAIRGVA